MSNEELAQLIQGGHTEYMAQLWEQQQGLLRKLSSRYLWRARRMCYDMEDLMQECYFALADAVAAYDPAKGWTFNSYIGYHVKNALADMLRMRNGTDKYIQALSTNQPIETMDGEKYNLLTFIPGPDNVEDDALDAVELEDLRRLMREALDPEDEQLLREYYGDARPSVRVLAQRYGTTYAKARRRIENALREVRRAATRKGYIHPRRIYSYRGRSPTESSATHNLEQERQEMNWLSGKLRE